MKSIVAIVALLFSFSQLPAQMAPPSEQVEENKQTDIVPDQDARPINLSEVLSKVQYPELARDAGIEGDVIIRIELDEAGRYVGYTEVASPSELLTEAVTDVMSQLYANPAIVNGEATPSAFKVRIGFKLDE